MKQRGRSETVFLMVVLAIWLAVIVAIRHDDARKQAQALAGVGLLTVESRGVRVRQTSWPLRPSRRISAVYTGWARSV
jgi:hypothetical protein